MFSEIKHELRFYVAAGRLILKYPFCARYVGYLLKIRKAQRKMRRLIIARRPEPVRKSIIDIDQLGSNYWLVRAQGETDDEFGDRIYDAITRPGEKQRANEVPEEDVRHEQC